MNGLIWLSNNLCVSHSIREQSNRYGSWFILNLKHRCKEYHSSKIVKIESVISDKLVYDIQCEGNIFCAGVNNIRVHNCEHEDEFYRLKLNNTKCGWTNDIVLEKQIDRPTEYTKLRKINFNNGIKYLREKWDIKGWVAYKNLERAKQ